jgi:hypothetical protein
LSIEARTEKLQDDIITDDLLNYAYMNNREYTIGSVVTPLIALEITMPKSSNLVFLSTINLESTSTETREVTETIIINGEPCEIVRTEKMPVIVEAYFEWNGAEILSNKPTETYAEDGKHLLNLMFFTIGGRQAGNLSTFRVLIKAKHGQIYIGANQVNATIISKGSTAGNMPWDGTINVEEELAPITAGTFAVNVNSVRDTAGGDTQSPAPSVATDNIGLITPDFDTISITGIDDSVEPTTT